MPKKFDWSFYDASRQSPIDFSPMVRGAEAYAAGVASAGQSVGAGLKTIGDRRAAQALLKQELDAKSSEASLNRAHEIALARSEREAQNKRSAEDNATTILDRMLRGHAENQRARNERLQAKADQALRDSALNDALKLRDDKDLNPLVETTVTLQELDPDIAMLSPQELEQHGISKGMTPEEAKLYVKSKTTKQKHLYRDVNRDAQAREHMLRRHGEVGLEAYDEIYGKRPVEKLGLAQEMMGKAGTSRADNEFGPTPKSAKDDAEKIQVGGKMLEDPLNIRRGGIIEDLTPEERAVIDLYAQIEARELGPTDPRMETDALLQERIAQATENVLARNRWRPREQRSPVGMGDVRAAEGRREREQAATDPQTRIQGIVDAVKAGTITDDAQIAAALSAAGFDPQADVDDGSAPASASAAPNGSAPATTGSLPRLPELLQKADEAAARPQPAPDPVTVEGRIEIKHREMRAAGERLQAIKADLKAKKQAGEMATAAEKAALIQAWDAANPQPPMDENAYVKPGEKPPSKRELANRRGEARSKWQRERDKVLKQ